MSVRVLTPAQLRCTQKPHRSTESSVISSLNSFAKRLMSSLDTRAPLRTRFMKSYSSAAIAWACVS